MATTARAEPLQNNWPSAAAAAGDQDLGADLVGMVEQQDSSAALAGGEGAHESRRTGAQDDDVKRLRRPGHCRFALLPVTGTATVEPAGQRNGDSRPDF
jgi:hypothetical protein